MELRLVIFIITNVAEVIFLLCFVVDFNCNAKGVVRSENGRF